MGLAQPPVLTVGACVAGGCTWPTPGASTWAQGSTGVFPRAMYPSDTYVPSTRRSHSLVVRTAPRIFCPGDWHTIVTRAPFDSIAVRAFAVDGSERTLSTSPLVMTLPATVPAAWAGVACAPTSRPATAPALATTVKASRCRFRMPMFVCPLSGRREVVCAPVTTVPEVG
jgi:hypothetical protein